MAVAETVERKPLTGVEGIWVLIGVDSCVFALLFASFMQARLADPAAFDSARQTLNADLGGVNTLVLLTSSWAVALAIQALRRGLTAGAQRWLLVGVCAGATFVVIKLMEYADKVAQGATPAAGDFYMWYFALTGIHLVHVMLGVGLLTHVLLGIRAASYDRTKIVVPECVALFWHLVDYVWIFIFPLLYLMKAA